MNVLRSDLPLIEERILKYLSPYLMLTGFKSEHDAHFFGHCDACFCTAITKTPCRLPQAAAVSHAARPYPGQSAGGGASCRPSGVTACPPDYRTCCLFTRCAPRAGPGTPRPPPLRRHRRSRVLLLLAVVLVRYAAVVAQ